MIYGAWSGVVGAFVPMAPGLSNFRRDQRNFIRYDCSDLSLPYVTMSRWDYSSSLPSPLCCASALISDSLGLSFHVIVLIFRCKPGWKRWNELGGSDLLCSLHCCSTAGEDTDNHFSGCCRFVDVRYWVCCCTRASLVVASSLDGCTCLELKQHGKNQWQGMWDWSTAGFPSSISHFWYVPPLAGVPPHCPSHSVGPRWACLDLWQCLAAGSPIGDSCSRPCDWAFSQLKKVQTPTLSKYKIREHFVLFLLALCRQKSFRIRHHAILLCGHRCDAKDFRDHRSWTSNLSKNLSKNFMSFAKFLCAEWRLRVLCDWSLIQGSNRSVYDITVYIYDIHIIYLSRIYIVIIN